MTAPAHRGAAVLQRVRQRLLQHLALETRPQHITLQADALCWNPFLPGIERKVLHQQGQAMSCLLRLAPGAKLPPHPLPMDEECLVLEGILRIGQELSLPAGSYHLARQGLAPEAMGSDTGAVVFLHGTVLQAADLQR